MKILVTGANGFIGNALSERLCQLGGLGEGHPQMTRLRLLSRKFLRPPQDEKHNYFYRTSETVLRFLPPYILERKHVDTAIAALDGILTSLTSMGAALAGQAPAGEHSHG